MRQCVAINAEHFVVPLIRADSIVSGYYQQSAHLGSNYTWSTGLHVLACVTTWSGVRTGEIFPPREKKTGGKEEGKWLFLSAKKEDLFSKAKLLMLNDIKKEIRELLSL